MLFLAFPIACCCSCWSVHQPFTLLLEVPIQEVENCRQWLRDAMIHVMDLSVPLEVEVNTGKDWFDASK